MMTYKADNSHLAIISRGVNTWPYKFHCAIEAVRRGRTCRHLGVPITASRARACVSLCVQALKEFSSLTNCALFSRPWRKISVYIVSVISGNIRLPWRHSTQPKLCVIMMGFDVRRRKAERFEVCGPRPTNCMLGLEC